MSALFFFSAPTPQKTKTIYSKPGKSRHGCTWEEPCDVILKSSSPHK
uniref:Uncharacterized protein n=1 Tax=Rhizophora mucronata TaxID=61149 RepID=A0A2P2JJ15_RHIMU